MYGHGVEFNSTPLQSLLLFGCLIRYLCNIRYCFRRQVYGLQLGRSMYSVYDHWQNTPYQRAEMLEYNGTATFEQCDGAIALET